MSRYVVGYCGRDVDKDTVWGKDQERGGNYAATMTFEAARRMARSMPSKGAKVAVYKLVQVSRHTAR